MQALSWDYSIASSLEYTRERRRYDFDRMAIMVTSKPIIPVIVKTRAIPRAGPVPNQTPIESTQAPVVMNGMNMNWAIGPIIKAVRGDAAISTL